MLKRKEKIMKNKIRNRDGRGRFTATKMEEKMRKLRTPQQWEKICLMANNGFCGRASQLAEKNSFETKHLLDAFDKNAHGLTRLDLAQILERRAVYAYKQREKKTNSEIETPKTEKVEKAEYTCPLNVENEEVNAKIKIIRYGQEDPAISNKVVVQAFLYLPVINFGIPPEIQFGEKVQVFEERLGENWGKLFDHETLRVSGIEFAGTSFPALFEEARNYAFGEIAKINNLLDVRHQALVDAN